MKNKFFTCKFVPSAQSLQESLKIPYTHHTYACEEFVDGLQIADKLSLPYEQVYKTLVTVSNSKNYFVFVIPIAAELDLKKAAKSVGEKRVERIRLTPEDLAKAAKAEFADIIRHEN